MSPWQATCLALQALWPPIVVAALLALLVVCISRSGSVRERAGISLMFGTFGVLVGVFVGASKTPVVGTVFAPSIALLTGYIAQVTSKDVPSPIRRLLVYGILLLIACLLFTTFYFKLYTS